MPDVRTVVNHRTGEEFISIKDLIGILEKDELCYYRMGQEKNQRIIEYIEELKGRMGKLVK